MHVRRMEPGVLSHARARTVLCPAERQVVRAPASLVYPGIFQKRFEGIRDPDPTGNSKVPEGVQYLNPAEHPV